ncbi:MAG: HIT family protein [Steroidobacteraceae bacterium]
MSDHWEQRRAGVGCPLCAPRPDVNESVLLVRKLPVSSLYLARNQTYRGQCMLVYDVRHVNRLDELELAEWQALARDIWLAGRAVTLEFDPQHMNVESLGNEVPHLHWHLIPRYRDDGRWGGPIWTTQSSELRSLRLPEAQYLDRVRALAGRIDALESGIASA